MKKKILAVLKYVLFLSVGLALLYLALRGLDLNLIIEEFKNAKYAWILLSLIPGFIALVSRSIRWGILISELGYNIKPTATFHATIMGYFANIIFPRLGEVARCTALSRSQNIPFNSLFGTVIAERIFDLLSLVVIAFIVVIAQFGFLREFLETLIWTPLTSKILSSFWLIAVLGISVLLAVLLFYILIRFSMPYIRKFTFYRKIKDLFIGFMAGTKSIMNLRRKKAFIVHTLIIWGMYFLMSYIPFRALQATEHLTLIDGTTLLMMGTIGFVIPVPAGIGAYHYIVTKTLTELFGIVSESAASFAVLTHASQLILIIFIAIFSFAYFLTRKNKPLNVKIRNHSEKDIDT